MGFSEAGNQAGAPQPPKDTDYNDLVPQDVRDAIVRATEGRELRLPLINLAMAIGQMDRRLNGIKAEVSGGIVPGPSRESDIGDMMDALDPLRQAVENLPSDPGTDEARDAILAWESSLSQTR